MIAIVWKILVSCFRLWCWSLVVILRLNFVWDSETEFWSTCETIENSYFDEGTQPLGPFCLGHFFRISVPLLFALTKSCDYIFHPFLMFCFKTNRWNFKKMSTYNFLKYNLHDQILIAEYIFVVCMNLIRVDGLFLLCNCEVQMYSDLSLHYCPVMELQHCHNRSKGIYIEATKAQLNTRQ